MTERYVEAALRTVPARHRDDIGAELRASIADQVDARVRDGEQPEAAERGVLTELGDPDKLAASYTDRPLHLIGPRYFLVWWRLLKLLLWIVLPCVAFGLVLAHLIAGDSGSPTVGTIVVALMSAALHLVFWTTLVFAILERVTTGSDGALPGDCWTLDELPEPREAGATFPDLV